MGDVEREREHNEKVFEQLVLTHPEWPAVLVNQVRECFHDPHPDYHALDSLLARLDRADSPRTWREPM